MNINWGNVNWGTVILSVVPLFIADFTINVLKKERRRMNLKNMKRIILKAIKKAEEEE